MTALSITRMFIGGVSAQAPFIRVPSSSATSGRVELVTGETLSLDTLVTPILRYRAPQDMAQGSLVSVNDSGVRHRTFRSILTENAERYEQGERWTDAFGKMTLSALLGWLDISSEAGSVDRATYVLDLFPREPTLPLLRSVSRSRGRLSPVRRGGLSVTEQWLYFGRSWSHDWQNLLDEEQGNS